MIREGLRNNSSTLTQFTQGYCHTWGPHKYSFPFQSQNCIFLETQESQNQMLQPKLIECKTMYYNSKTAFPYEMEKIHILPRKIVLKEHNLGPLGTESAFSGSTIFQEHNLDSLGTQYWLSYNTIYILREHNFVSPGTKSQFSEKTIFPFLKYNPCSLGTQLELSWNTITVSMKHFQPYSVLGELKFYSRRTISHTLSFLTPPIVQTMPEVSTFFFNASLYYVCLIYEMLMIFISTQMWKTSYQIPILYKKLFSKFMF